jgi:hypothetical protein
VPAFNAELAYILYGDFCSCCADVTATSDIIVEQVDFILYMNDNKCTGIN